MLKNKSEKNLHVLWHTVPLIILLTLLTALIKNKILPRYQSSPSKNKQKSELKALDNHSADAISFYKNAARYIETWLNHHTEKPEIKNILQTRDALCYQPQSSNILLEKEAKQNIVKLLRKLTIILVFCFSFISMSFGAETESASELYNKGQYRNAANAWLAAGNYSELSAQTLYNIGNCCYRLGLPGQAALFYRRALVADSTFAEATQNLHFIERANGSLTLELDPALKKITLFSKHSIKQMTYAIAWLTILSIVTLYTLNPSSMFRMIATVILFLSPVLLTIFIYAWSHYPNEANFAKLEQQAVIVVSDAIAFTDASRTSAEVITAPAGSLCRIIQTSNRWVYVSFASDKRGWLPTETIEKLLISTKPVIPKSISENQNKAQ